MLYRVSVQVFWLKRLISKYFAFLYSFEGVIFLISLLNYHTFNCLDTVSFSSLEELTSSS